MGRILAKKVYREADLVFDTTLYTRAFTSLITANMFFWMSTSFFLPVLPLYYHSLGMNDHQVGLAIGAYSLGAILFRMAAGKAVDRYGSAPVIGAGIGLSICAIISYNFGTTLILATVSRFLHGVGISGYSAAALTMASLMHGGEHTTEAVSIYTLFTMFGVGLATSSANWLYAHWQMPVVISVGVAATILALVLFPMKQPLKQKSAAAQALPLKTIISQPNVYVPTIGLFAANFCYGSIMTFLPLLMLSRGNTNVLSVFYVAYAIAVILARVWVGQLCNKFTPERLSMYLLLILAGAMLIAGNFDGWWVLALAGLGIGIGYGFAFPTLTTIVAKHTQPANRGAAIGFFTTAVDIGFAVGSIGMGFIAARWGYEAVFTATGIYTIGYAVVYRLWLSAKMSASEAVI